MQHYRCDEGGQPRDSAFGRTWTKPGRQVFFGGLRRGVHHVEGEGEAGGFEVKAMIVDFLFKVLAQRCKT